MTARVGVLSESIPGDHAVVVFPHAGASPRFFAPWSRELRGDFALYGVTYPGRDMLMDEPAPETLVELADQCAIELEPIVRSSNSVVMFGHSMGSLVALEAIRSLERSGLAVTALVASGSDAPHLGTDQTWHRASDDELVAHLTDLAPDSREVFAIPELRDMLLPVSREDFRLVETYRSELHPRISCPIHVVNGDSDPEVTLSGAAKWASHTGTKCFTRSLPGDHFYLSAHRAQIIDQLSTILASPQTN